MGEGTSFRFLEEILERRVSDKGGDRKGWDSSQANRKHSWTLDWYDWLARLVAVTKGANKSKVKYRKKHSGLVAQCHGLEGRVGVVLG